MFVSCVSVLVHNCPSSVWALGSADSICETWTCPRGICLHKLKCTSAGDNTVAVFHMAGKGFVLLCVCLETRWVGCLVHMPSPLTHSSTSLVGH